MENTCNNSTERKTMATKASDPAMAAFVQTLKAMFQETAAGKRLIQNGATPQDASIFIGKDYKVLAQMSHWKDLLPGRFFRWVNNDCGSPSAALGSSVHR